jgi:hypothetical protein
MKAGFESCGNQNFRELSLPNCPVFGTEMPPMKKLSIFFAIITTVLTGKATLPQPDLIAHIHFAGGQNICSDRSFLPFAGEFTSPEAKALANQTFDKLSHAPFGWFKSRLPAKAEDGSAQLRPLFNDLVSSEWVFEARDLPGGSPEYVLAIRLGSDRARIWKNNLQQLLEAWTGIQVRQIQGGWELKKHLPPNLIQVTDNAGWLLVDCGQDQLNLGGRVSGALADEANNASVWATGDKEWLSADINWPRLGQWSGTLKSLDLPEIQLKVTASDKNLQVNGKCFFPENLELKLPHWQIPTNTIQSPFVSLTAARGFSKWLNSQDWARPYDLAPAPDQVFMWALRGIPFETLFAIPVSDSTDALAKSYEHLNPAINSANSRNELFSPIKVVMANRQVQFQGVPYAAPFLQAVDEHSGHFLLAGAFTYTPDTTPLPPELLQQMAKTNLAYYHWEITAERFPQLLEITQLGLLMTQHQQLGTDSAALNWMRKITPHLGNTVTEIFLTGPDEMSFTRSAPGGMTAFEFLALGNWLEAANFPGCDLSLPADSPFYNKSATAGPPNVPVPHH